MGPDARDRLGTLGRCRAVVREAAAAALAQRVASLLTVVVVAALCSTVLITAGSAAGGAERVLSSLDASGTRSIVVRAEPRAGLNTSVLDRLHASDSIEWAGAFGFADDVTNISVDGGARVALRPYYGSDLGDEGMLTTDAAALLGFADGTGTVVATSSGRVVDLRKTAELPEELAFLAPVVLLPTAPTGPATSGRAGPLPVAVLVVRAASPALVGQVADVVTSLLGVDDPTTVTVQTSEQLAAVRQEVEGQLGGFAHSLVLAVFGAAAALVAAILLALVVLRRRDFGRRRALGASRSMISALLLVQVGLLGVVAAALGVAIALLVLSVGEQPLPTTPFTLATGLLAIVTSLAAAVVPALIASTRDPLRELRVA